MTIEATPDELREGADQCNTTGNDFLEQLNSLKSRLDGLGWKGDAREAFVEMFEGMHRQLSDVQTTLGTEGGVGRLLLNAADGYAANEAGLKDQFLSQSK